ncbi:MAG: molybdate ABC transporter substrate-binding protein [Opitutales bacterium]
MKPIFRVLPAVCWLLLLVACGKQPAGTTSRPALSVYVAASLTDVMEAVGAAYERRAGVELVFSFAGSGALAQQLVAAPRADLFISASERWMDTVEAAGRLRPDTRVDLLANRLVIIAHPAADYALAVPGDLGTLPFRLLAMGDPAFVPAGKYARSWLEAEETARGGSLWSAVSDRVSPAPDVRAALAQVASRRDVVGLVYQTDVLARPDAVRVLYAVPLAAGPPIRYVAAVLADAPEAQAALDFLEFLRGDEARAIFAAHRFLPAPPA